MGFVFCVFAWRHDFKLSGHLLFTKTVDQIKSKVTETLSKRTNMSNPPINNRGWDFCE